MQTKKDANSYLKGLCNFPFIIGLIITHYFLHSIHATTVRLQGTAVDIVKAYNEINSVMSDLQYQRDNIEQHFSSIFKHAKVISNSVSVDVTMPR